MRTYSRSTSFLLCTGVYLLALLVAAVYVLACGKGQTLLFTTFVATILATLTVYAFSMLFRNASLYDPFWSVAPMAIVWYWADIFQPFLLMHVLFIAAVWLWGIRLTLNWARGWQGLGHMDWRYSMLQNKNPKTYWLVNLAGIQLFPTLMIFLGSLPAYYALYEMQVGTPVLLHVGFAVCLLATVLEFIADEQLRSFKRQSAPDDFIKTGLWRYSRHPNYFAEILFWFGLWLMAIGVTFATWWTAVGWIAMVLLFLCISIPMMEKKNLANKPGYAAYIAAVSRLIPWMSKL